MLLGIALSACSAAPPPCKPSRVSTLSGDVQPILSANCAGVECHGPFFVPGKTWSRIVGVAAPECGDRPYVAPGDPVGSYLFDKVAGVDLCAGVQMPRNAPPLAADEQEAIADWICAGALDN